MSIGWDVRYRILSNFGIFDKISHRCPRLICLFFLFSSISDLYELTFCPKSVISLAPFLTRLLASA